MASTPALTASTLTRTTYSRFCTSPGTGPKRSAELLGDLIHGCQRGQAGQAPVELEPQRASGT